MFSKIQIDWRKKEWHITTDVRTGSGVSGKKPRKKCCGNMELMKLPSNKSVLTTGQTLIPTGGFTIGQAISGFYRYLNDVGEYLEGMADREQSAEVKTVEDLLDEIEDENLYQACSPGICVIVNTYPCLLLITGLPSASKRSNVN